MKRFQRRGRKDNGEELDRVAGLNTLDYGARLYYPLVPAWDRMDKMCEKYYNISPYVYCGNNPMTFVDYDGNEKVRGFGYSDISNRKANNMIVDKFDDKQNSIVVFAHGNPNGFHAVGDNFNVIINTPQKFLSFLESQSDVWRGRYVLRDPIEIAEHYYRLGQSFH